MRTSEVLIWLIFIMLFTSGSSDGCSGGCNNPAVGELGSDNQAPKRFIVLEVLPGFFERNGRYLRDPETDACFFLLGYGSHRVLTSVPCEKADPALRAKMK
ncbi:MAG: hypothetical protein AAB879_01985 [Patescibacteria group bacterium]